jgi:Fe-S-cluster-containing hydrogenase component 2
MNKGMPAKLLVVNPKKCTGCGLCELACALKQTGKPAPQHARIRVVNWGAEGIHVPISCQQCSDAPCAAVCPRNAISQTPRSEWIGIDYSRCISCQMCVSACPFGAIWFDAHRSRVYKCDLCRGQPECVRACFTGALNFVDTWRLPEVRQRAAAARISGQRLVRGGDKQCPSSA